MEPHNNNVAPPAELPQPQTNYDSGSMEISHVNQTEHSVGQAVETATTKQNGSPASATAPPLFNSVLPLGAQVNTINPNPVINTSYSKGLIADDTDLIEKEWVIKAKEIVEQTKEDPYLQNKEMNKFKADYIKTRYNKDIRINED